MAPQSTSRTDAGRQPHPAARNGGRQAKCEARSRSPMLRPFVQVDVFAAGPYLGNPVAVVLNAEGLSTEAMQRFAHWTNLSETTFVLPPTRAEAEYRVRIFTPTLELPFAGHPTLGAGHAWLAHQ